MGQQPDPPCSACSSAEICSKCWTLMTIAVRIIDRALVGEGLGDPCGPWPHAPGTCPEHVLPHSNTQTPKGTTAVLMLSWGWGGSGGCAGAQWGLPRGFAALLGLDGCHNPSRRAPAAQLFPLQRTWA